MTTSHKTTIRTDYQPQIIVQPAEDPQWFPMLAWLHRSGLYPRLPQTPRDLLQVLCWQRWEQRTPRVIATIDQLAGWLGLTSPKAAYDAVRFLLEPPATIIEITGLPPRLLAKHGPTVWEPLPGRRFASRATTGDSPQSETGPPVFTLGGRFSPQSESLGAPSLEIPRASNPIPESDRDGSGLDAATPTVAGGRATLAAAERFMRARAAGKGDWTGYPLYWSLEGVTDVRLALGMCGVGDPIRTETIEDCARGGALTVAEIASVFEQVVSSPKLKDKPMSLVWKLHDCRRIEPRYRQRAEQARERRAELKVEEMERIRNERIAQARQRAGGSQ